MFNLRNTRERVAESLEREANWALDLRNAQRAIGRQAFNKLQEMPSPERDILAPFVLVALLPRGIILRGGAYSYSKMSRKLAAMIRP